MSKITLLHMPLSHAQIVGRHRRSSDIIHPILALSLQAGMQQQLSLLATGLAHDIRLPQAACPGM